MDLLWMKLQEMINDNQSIHNELVEKQLKFMLTVIEDHENDMKKMCEYINKLEARVSELEETLKGA